MKRIWLPHITSCHVRCWKGFRDKCKSSSQHEHVMLKKYQQDKQVYRFCGQASRCTRSHHLFSCPYFLQCNWSLHTADRGHTQQDAVLGTGLFKFCFDRKHQWYTNYLRPNCLLTKNIIRRIHEHSVQISKAPFSSIYCICLFFTAWFSYDRK